MATNSARPELRLDWCSHEAAKYAVENWHYSECMPSGKLVKVGVWESGKYIGSVMFGRGANHRLASPYGLTQLEACELVRVALDHHKTPVSKIVAIAVRMLARQSAGLRLIVSYADPSEGHVGTIYQAGNWIYCGKKKRQENYLVGGRWVHGRTATASKGTVKGLPQKYVEGKHCYLMPLDDAMRSQIIPLAKPYPKRAGSSVSGTSPVQGEGGGATPTPALQ